MSKKSKKKALDRASKEYRKAHPKKHWLKKK